MSAATPARANSAICLRNSARSPGPLSAQKYVRPGGGKFTDGLNCTFSATQTLLNLNITPEFQLKQRSGLGYRWQSQKSRRPAHPIQCRREREGGPERL